MLSSTVCKILIAVILLSGARHGGGRVVSFFAHLFRISILSLLEKNKQIKRWGYGGFVGCHHWNHCSTKRELVLVNHYTNCSSSKKLQEHLSWRLLVGPEACILHSPTKTQTACVSPSSYFFSIKSSDNHKDHHSFCSAYYSNNVSLALIL